MVRQRRRGGYAIARPPECSPSIPRMGERAPNRPDLQTINGMMWPTRAPVLFHLQTQLHVQFRMPLLASCLRPSTVALA